MPKICNIGCRFNLTQSCFRKIQSIGLVTDNWNEDSKVGQCLLFLKSNNVADCFVEDLYSVTPPKL